MIVVGLLLPFVYCVLVGMASSMVFKKRFIDSLAPAFFMQVILMLLTGCFFEKITLGIYIGIIVAVIILGFTFWKTKSFTVITEKIDQEFVLFSFIYVAIFFTNIGSFLHMWDEFSHWGWFVRESYKLDSLYCTSKAYFIHKDYPPGISLFEVLWCRLSLQYNEANAYRGINMLQASLMMPAIVSFLRKDTKYLGRRQRIVKIVVNTAIIFSIPLFSSLQVYHTLYQDLIMGVIVFYIIWLTISEKFSYFSLIAITLAMSNLVLCKLTAIAFIPILLVFYVVFHIFYSDLVANKLNIVVGTTISTVLSIIPWRMYNAYIDKYIGRANRGQSYSSLNLSSIIGVIKQDGSIPYQAEVGEKYFDALLSYPLVGRLSYVWIIVLCIVLAFFLMIIADDKKDIRRIRIIIIWVVLASIYYAIMMYFMYLLMFSEYEATGIASYSRYMSTYILTALLIVTTLYLYYPVKKAWYSYLIVVLLAENIVFCSGMTQFFPRALTGEGTKYKSSSAYINEHVQVGAKLLMTVALEDLGADLGITFNCDGISVSVYAFGEKKNDGDLWTCDVSLEEFVDIVSKYDYIYFFSYDDDFAAIYADAFAHPEDIYIGGLYQISVANGLLDTIPVK